MDNSRKLFYSKLKSLSLWLVTMSSFSILGESAEEPTRCCIFHGKMCTQCPFSCFQRGSWSGLLRQRRATAPNNMMEARTSLGVGCEPGVVLKETPSVIMVRGFPASPVVKVPCFHCRGHGFNPWSGN